MPSNLTSPEPFSALSADSKINDILCMADALMPETEFDLCIGLVFLCRINISFTFLTVLDFVVQTQSFSNIHLILSLAIQHDGLR